MARSKPVPVKSSKNQSKREGSSLRNDPKSKRNLIREDKKTRAGIKLASKAYGTNTNLGSGTAKIKEKRGKENAFEEPRLTTVFVTKLNKIKKISETKFWKGRNAIPFLLVGFKTLLARFESSSAT